MTSGQGPMAEVIFKFSPSTAQQTFLYCIKQIYSLARLSQEISEQLAYLRIVQVTKSVLFFVLFIHVIITLSQNIVIATQDPGKGVAKYSSFTECMM